MHPGALKWKNVVLHNCYADDVADDLYDMVTLASLSTVCCIIMNNILNP